MFVENPGGFSVSESVRFEAEIGQLGRKPVRRVRDSRFPPTQPRGRLGCCSLPPRARDGDERSLAAGLTTHLTQLVGIESLEKVLSSIPSGDRLNRRQFLKVFAGESIFRQAIGPSLDIRVCR
jgi:hypothetical protein